MLDVLRALNGNPHLQRSKILFIASIRSGLLSRLDHELIVDLDARRAFTVFKLMAILKEAHHSLIIVEHDPMLYDGAAEMVEYVSYALAEAAKKAAP